MKKYKLIIIQLITINFLFTPLLISQTVNEFTGGFSYSAPLLTVPSPYGPGVSIGASYGAGIGVNQSSSEIGLGWGINLGGVISRNVSGIPDDIDGISVADPQYGDFYTQGGVMYFNNGTSRQNMDFYKSTYKIDTPYFYFPDYDNYNLSGPGIGGKLQARLFDFATVELNKNTSWIEPRAQFSLNADHPFAKKMQFSLSDYAGNFKSRHYPTSPITSETSLRLPGYSFVDDEVTSSIPYVGVGNVGYDLTSNRLATAKYVEYFTNTEVNSKIADNSIGFINLPSSTNRTSANYVMDGIGAFRVTDQAGFVYYYTQPVYMNYTVIGNYPLKNDYSLMPYDTSSVGRQTDGGNYYLQDHNLSTTSGSVTTPFMIEWKQNARYAYNWLLTAVTGTDYVDSNSNGIVDDGDKGYWISYDWQAWTKNFTKRSPEYGFDYSFGAGEDDFTQDLEIDAATKISGKYGQFNKSNQEIYYLNKIHTASHTAIMVRDIKLDGHGSDIKYDEVQNNNAYSMPSGSGSSSYTSNSGTLYDDGGSSANCGSSCSSTVTISPTGASSITIRFPANSFNMASGDVVYIKNGSTTLATYSSSNGPPANGVTFNYSSLTIQESTGSGAHLAGFRMGWSSVHSTVVPELKLTRIVLFKNEDFANLTSPSSSSAYNVSTSIAAFDIAGVGVDKFYNETWYNHSANKSNIETASLQTVEFVQDYSLCKNYINNIKTNVCATDKFSAPSDVANGIYTPTTDYASSGKLTLNEIVSYSVGHVKTSPSILFGYNKTSTTDNPDYNPIKVDYAGFYKSDVTTNAYSGYTTATSGALADAWSMRNITSPMGGRVLINYESNQYEKVFDGNGGFRGPSKMYGIKSAVLNDSDTPTGWHFVMEEDGTAPSDFAELIGASSPSGTVKHVMIPVKSDDATTKFISSGTFSYTTSPNDQVVSESNFYTTPIVDNLYYTGSISDLSSLTDVSYTGNGYIHFDLPAGTAVNGGGIRVKSIVTQNGATDSYTQEYTYEGGVTPMEFDRFAEEKITTDKMDNVAHPVKLRAAAYDHHRMGPGIGYSKVTVKNKGQNNIANGSTQYNFITSDAGIDNFKANIQRRIGLEGGSSCVGGAGGSYSYTPGNDTSYIIEVVDKFSGYWGQLASVQTSDINDNILTKTVNTYSNLNQGSIVENYDFLTIKTKTTPNDPEPATVCTKNDHLLCIKRNYPVLLTKQTNYTQGINSTTEYLTFDPITGAATSVRSTSPNKGIAVTRTVPAFRISQYAAMGPKSVTASNANMVSTIAYTKTTIDSTITSSSDFANYQVQTFKKNLVFRTYDATNSKFINQSQSDKYWMADKSYNWVGTVGSIDNYGLFKQSELASAPFDYSFSTDNSNWRLGSENTLLDNSGHIIERRAFNNRFSAKKYGYGDTLQTAEASNCNFSSFTFCGFESKLNDLTGTGNYYSEGEVKINDGVKTTGTTSIPAHTGTYMVKLSSGSTGPAYSVNYEGTGSNGEDLGLQKARTYRASVWVYSSSPSDCKLSISLTGQTTQSISKSNTSNVTIGNWTLMNVEMTVPSSISSGDQLKVYLEPGTSGDAYFDDLRLHPVDASMSATVYEPKTNRVAATLDGNNFATIYKYDASGRVLEVWQELEGLGLKKMKKYQYNYARGLN